MESDGDACYILLQWQAQEQLPQGILPSLPFFAEMVLDSNTLTSIWVRTNGERDQKDGVRGGPCALSVHLLSRFFQWVYKLWQRCVVVLCEQVKSSSGNHTSMGNLFKWETSGNTKSSCRKVISDVICYLLGLLNLFLWKVQLPQSSWHRHNLRCAQWIVRGAPAKLDNHTHKIAQDLQTHNIGWF